MKAAGFKVSDEQFDMLAVLAVTGSIEGVTTRRADDRPARYHEHGSRPKARRLECRKASATIEQPHGIEKVLGGWSSASPTR